MNIAAIAHQKDFALPAVLAAVTVLYLCTAALWLSQLL